MITPPVILHRPCYTVASAEDSDTLSASLEIQGDVWKITRTAYEDDQCQKAYLLFTIRSQAQQNEDQLNLQTQQVSYTALSDQVSRALNDISYCGFQDWQTNQAKIVTGHACEDYQTPKQDQVIYSRSKNQDGKLFLGQASADKNGQTPEQRFEDLGDGPYERSNLR